jgi:tetratricopeptide (TPR) repeat protein
MSVRFRKSIGLGHGMRLTLGKHGVSASAGVPGYRTSFHSSGRVTRTIGIPGTGVYSVSRVDGGSSQRRARAAQPVQMGYTLKKPGLFAGKAEKRYHEAVAAFLEGRDNDVLVAADEVLTGDPSAISAHLLAAVAAVRSTQPMAVVEGHLEAVLASEHTMPDRLQTKYLPPIRMAAGITTNVLVEVPFGAIGAALLLAEAYQLDGRLDEAIGLVQQLDEVTPDDPVIRLSLCDLLVADGDYGGALETSASAVNDGDVGVATLHLRGAALFGLGQPGAAIEAFTAALAKRAGRDAGLLMTVRYDRALAHLAAGQKSKARGDLEKIIAADPGYLDVRDRLASLT